jgi:hypothetical protein
LDLAGSRPWTSRRTSRRVRTPPKRGRPNLKDWIEQEGFEVGRAEGIHVVSWQFLPKPLLTWLDQKLRSSSYRYALNAAILAKRP